MPQTPTLPALSLSKGQVYALLGNHELERWLLKRRKVLPTSSHVRLANDKHDVISFLFANIYIVQFYNA